MKSPIIGAFGTVATTPPFVIDEIVNCGNCMAFKRVADDKPEGVCHRHPPQVVVMPMAVQSQFRPAEHRAASACPPTVATGGCFDFLPDAETSHLILENRKVFSEMRGEASS